jgi:hypothetical protein
MVDVLTGPALALSVIYPPPYTHLDRGSRLVCVYGFEPHFSVRGVLPD